MKKTGYIEFTGFAIGGLFCLSLAALAAEPDYPEIIKYRRSIMKSQREHMAAAASIVQGKVPYAEQLMDHVVALEATTRVIATLFPAGTDAGDTAALPAIWTNADEFKKRAMDTSQKVAALAMSVKSGEAHIFSARLNDLLDSCKMCHKTFRKKDQ